MFNLFLFAIRYVTFTSIITHCETKQEDLKNLFLPFFPFLMCTYWNAGEGNWRRLPRDAKATAIGSEFCWPWNVHRRSGLCENKVLLQQEEPFLFQSISKDLSFLEMVNLWEIFQGIKKLHGDKHFTLVRGIIMDKLVRKGQSYIYTTVPKPCLEKDDCSQKNP